MYNSKEQPQFILEPVTNFTLNSNKLLISLKVLLSQKFSHKAVRSFFSRFLESSVKMSPLLPKFNLFLQFDLTFNYKHIDDSWVGDISVFREFLS